MTYSLYQYFCNLKKIFTNYPQFRKKTMETRIINIFNKNERTCRDIKTQKVYKQGREVNVGPKIKETTSV